MRCFRLLLLCSCSVLWPHGLQHARLPCLSPSPRACSNSCPLSWWRHSTISFSVNPFSSCPQSFPASGSFQMSQIFIAGHQSIGSWASESVLPMLGLISFRIDWFDLLAVQETLKSYLQHHSLKASILQCSAFTVLFILLYLIFYYPFLCDSKGWCIYFVKNSEDKKTTKRENKSTSNCPILWYNGGSICMTLIFPRRCT